ncbi:alpha/beta fold hydrolase [Streptomyces sp. NPDC047821]|uniref:alpha/beta fold hydrolase n=1 Tax=Streptomyces sp. NPDC047821 TaxID=3365488 RepID=UPI003723A2D9
MAESIAELPGASICYETIGNPNDRPLLLVFGLHGQLIWWDDELCRLLAARGFFVVRFDNRDSGRSSRTPSRPHPIRAAVRLSRPAYTLADMARDAINLLDHIGVSQAHVVGASMGGMIAQLMAIEHPQRLLSLTLLMTTPGHLRIGFRTDFPLLAWMLRGHPEDREGYVRDSMAMIRKIAGRHLSLDEEGVRRMLYRNHARGVSNDGTRHQLAAILTAPDRLRALRKIDLPVHVIHGSRDPIIPIGNAVLTAEAVKEGRLSVVPGMGHYLPPEAWPPLIHGLSALA